MNHSPDPDAARTGNNPGPIAVATPATTLTTHPGTNRPTDTRHAMPAQVALPPVAAETEALRLAELLLSAEELSALSQMHGGDRPVGVQWLHRFTTTAIVPTDDGDLRVSTEDVTVVCTSVAYHHDQTWNGNAWVDEPSTTWWHGPECLTHRTSTEDSNRGCKGHIEQALAVRQAQVRAQVAETFGAGLDTRYGRPWARDVNAAADVTWWLYQRVQRGEFIGQRRDELIYLQEICAIMDWDISFGHQVMAELGRRRLLAYNGLILWPWQAKEDGYRMLKERTGHRRIEISDFGHWGCSACGANGDERDNPRDTPCTPAAATH